MSYLQDNVLAVVCDPEKRLKRVPMATLQAFQGALKTLDEVQYERLRMSLIEEGFAAPVFVWHGHDKVLDGHQRLIVIEREEWVVEGGVPVVDIEAEDEQEAARKVLRVYSAVYGQIDAQGLYDFATAHEIDVIALDVPFPDFEADVFASEFYDTEDSMPPLPDGEKEPYQQMTFTLHDQQAEEVKGALVAAKKNSGIESDLNDNSNGNALAFICQTFITAHGLG